MKKDVIKDNRTGKTFWDTGIIRSFETILKKDITLEEAKKEYPEIQEV